MSESQKDELIELAWGLIANAGGGNWQLESPEWRAAAQRWRDLYAPPAGISVEARV